ncbi:hypothetical protein Bca52824_036281 [Brassica carinata]|uniref:Elongin-C n=1 Tax=Brassica carinata TaxID=52824 RepID=A0A8X7S3L0_BRACI|nr:hypothetical protein Bca52824_036281 [Brassica carinata]
MRVLGNATRRVKTTRRRKQEETTKADRDDEEEEEEDERDGEVDKHGGFRVRDRQEAAMVSQTIRSMLTSPGGFSESKDGVVTFPDISTTILEKICQYFYWSLQYSRGKETEFHIEPEFTLELMMAANYLHT